MDLMSLCVDKFISEAHKYNDNTKEQHKHLSGLCELSKNIFNKTNLFKLLIKNFPIYVLKYINDDIKTMPKNIDKLQFNYN
jgi:hypothetical protein